MIVKILFDRENKKQTMELDDNSKVNDVLSKLNINPVTVIIARNKEIIAEDEVLKDNDEIDILSVVSGG